MLSHNAQDRSSPDLCMLTNNLSFCDRSVDVAMATNLGLNRRNWLIPSVH